MKIAVAVHIATKNTLPQQNAIAIHATPNSKFLT